MISKNAALFKWHGLAPEQRHGGWHFSGALIECFQEHVCYEDEEHCSGLSVAALPIETEAARLLEKVVSVETQCGGT
jgi:hypothetical protein